MVTIPFGTRSTTCNAISALGDLNAKPAGAPLTQKHRDYCVRIKNSAP
jgi:hypothetical protein